MPGAMYRKGISLYSQPYLGLFSTEFWIMGISLLFLSGRIIDFAYCAFCKVRSQNINRSHLHILEELRRIYISIINRFRNCLVICTLE